MNAAEARVLAKGDAATTKILDYIRSSISQAALIGYHRTTEMGLLRVSKKQRDIVIKKLEADGFKVVEKEFSHEISWEEE